MVDYFALAITHGLLMLAVLRLCGRDDIDRDDPPAGSSSAAEGTAVRGDAKTAVPRLKPRR